jgi:hypothetical protein
MAHHRRLRATMNFEYSQMMHNPSLERTRYGMPRRALISFWALRVLPQRAAQLKR